MRKCGEMPQCRQRREDWGGAVVTNALSLAQGLVKPAQGTLWDPSFCMEKVQGPNYILRIFILRNKQETSFETFLLK